MGQLHPRSPLCRKNSGKRLGERRRYSKLTGSPRGPDHPGEPWKGRPESGESGHPTHSSNVSHHMTYKVKAHSPLGQEVQESQGGQGCLEPHRPQGCPKEGKGSRQEGTLPQCLWLAEGAQTTLHQEPSPHGPPSARAETRPL